MRLEHNNLSIALEPNYSLKSPNQPIQLYEGVLDVFQEGSTRRGNGAIYLKWFPFPQIEFQLTCEESLQLRGAETTFKFSDLENPVKALISINDRLGLTGKSMQITGRAREPIILGLGQSLSCLQFHLTNFEDFFGSDRALLVKEKEEFIAQRAILEAGDWRITIDQLKTTTADIKILKAQGGYAVTHVGKLEKVSGDDFTADSGRNVLKALSDFLSFVRGLRVVPVLLIGYNSAGNSIWQEWVEAKTASPWQNVNSWAWGVTATNFEKAFPGFWSWWHTWNDAARRVIYWYVESNNQAGAIEGSCVLEQATLELIAWKFLTAEFEGDAKLSDNKKQFKYPSQKLNHLLAKLDIPQKIPDDLTTLITLANNQNWDDNGALIFVKIRNNITHSDPSNQNRIKNISLAARVETWELGLWYLELILLRLFHYQGVYFNRLRQGVRHFGDLDLVPWLVPRIDQYVQAAMNQVSYAVLEDNGACVGEVPGFEALQVSADTREACQQKLENALRKAIVVELQRGNSLPIINGIDLNCPTEDVAD
jgi:hypothetical protein